MKILFYVWHSLPNEVKFASATTKTGFGHIILLVISSSSSTVTFSVDADLL